MTALKMNHVTEGAPLPKGDEQVLEASEGLAEAVQRERDTRRRLHNVRIELEDAQAAWAYAKRDVRRCRRLTVKASKRPLWTRIMELLNGV